MAMNPNVNMASMNPMGGPVGGAPVPMMNNGQAAAAAAAAAASARQHQQQNDQRGALNTYIYEYFIRQGMFDCARSLLSSDHPVNVNKDGVKGGAVNGVGDDSMDQDTKGDLDTKLPDDLPPPKLPMSSDTSFLYEWFCLFWDIYNAQRSKGGNGNINQYVAHTQQQSRLKQNQQQELLRNMRPENMAQYQQMMRMQQNGAMNMQMKQGNLARAAMANNQNNPMMMQQQQQAKQNQMQRDPSSMDGNRDRPSSPANGENAPSPSKRQRVDNAPFTPNQPAGMMPNGRPGQNMPPQQMPGGPAAAQMLSAHGINPGQLGQPQFTNFMPNAGPQGQGSPMMAQGPDGNAAMNYTYNPAGEMAPGGLRPGAPGTAQAAGGSNHALQDYQMQLMLLEQQNKKRLMMARQEQDNIGGIPREGQPPGPGGPGVPTGPNGQGFPEASPQAMRAGASPNPTEQMKRGTPQMNNSGIPSPVPEGGPQSRESPNPTMNFMGNADPNVAPHFFNKGADGNMVQATMNGMRPPSSHPGGQQPFNPQMNHQQIMAARQAAAQQGQNPQQWQQGPNGQMIPAGMQQSPQVQGTPQQRPMAPPSAPAANNANNRTTASPQQAAAAPPTPNQGNKAAPKGKKKGETAKDKRAANQKKNQNVNNASATPAAESTNDAESAAPATPITPVNQSFKNGQNGTGPNSQPNASAAPPQTAVPAPQPPVAQPQGHDPNSNGLNMDNFNMGFDHMDMSNGLQTGDMLNDFDFDSFLNDNDNENQPFDFNGAFGGVGEEGIDATQ